MDGFETVAALRSLEAGTGNHLPAVALTAHAMKGDRERCLAAGFDDYLSKPIRREELARVLGGISAPDAAAPIDGERLLRALAESVGDDEAFAREVLATFLDSAPRLVSRLGIAARDGNASGVVAEAHGLKGISLAIGADSLANACQAAELAAARGDLGAARSATEVVGPEWERLRGSLARVMEAAAV
jgi:HPt (histidine-containing phosphotransfer) domain-containing protein